MKNSATSCWKTENRIRFLYTAGFLLVAGMLICGILTGSTQLSFSDISKAFTDGFGETTGTRIFAYVRLPRTLAALLCGAALSVSGAVLQNVLANRLASPSIIGVNSGAGLAVTLSTALGILGGWQLSLFSFLGAFVTVVLISFCIRKWNSSSGTVILLGVAINSLLGAITDSIITFLPEVAVMSNDFRIGEFTSVTYSQLVPASILIVVTIIILLTLSTQLDVLTLGTDSAKSLGMNTTTLELLFLLLSALLAGCAVCLAGLLSFVGLIVPHAVRLMGGRKASHLLGLSALFGGAFVCLCDTVARTAFTPYEIPVGIIMAFLGAPFFIFVLIKGRGNNPND